MSNIRVIRASAGSGKTKSLIGFFLELLITEPTDYFRHILAVTFTNKATEEMKERIIHELNILACGDDSWHLDDLIEVSHFKEDHIRSKATAILQNILHNYSWFSVETIDTFFQRIIKAFTREMGIPGNYAIEIDTTQALRYAVDGLIDSLNNDPSLLNWMIDFSENKIEEGKSWDFKFDLEKLGSEIFKEEFSAESDSIYRALSDKDRLNNFRKQLYEKITKTETQLSEYGGRGLAVISENGLDEYDFYQKGKGIVTFFRKMQSKKIERPNTYVSKLHDGPEIWPSGDTSNRDLVIQLAEATLLPILRNISTFLEDVYASYVTARVVLKNLHMLGILSDLSEKIIQYRSQHNSFLLSDSAGFIYKIIDNNVSPFIYEKMGNRYNNFLIDEFQDTSGMQWKNLLPLIENSISQGYDCLLVGDVKQSIYRWRNSNWEILSSEIHKDFQKEYIKFQDLKFNWRSCKNNVDFISAIFPKAIEIAESDFKSTSTEFLDNYPELKSTISEIYAGVDQAVASRNTFDGYVKLQFLSRQEMYTDIAQLLDLFCQDINLLVENGYKPGEIAVLVRGKNEGKLIAEHLIQKNSEGSFSNSIHVISDESLFLSSSDSVNLLIAALQYLLHPDDDINRGKLIAGILSQKSESGNQAETAEVILNMGMSTMENISYYLPQEFTGQIDSLRTLPLYELVERLVLIFNADSHEKDVAYIHAFLDLVHDYTHSNPADIDKFLDFWEEEGSGKSVPSAESQNAIRILTIHKAKGLEFKAVIVPFCNWSLDQKANEILWMKPGHEDFNYFPMIPVNYSKGLAETLFSDVYYKERLKSYIDNLNLLYVSFTRAEETLIVYPFFSDSKRKNLSTVGDLLCEVISGGKTSEFAKHYSEESKVFEIGSLEKKIFSEEGSGLDKYVLASRGKPAIEKLFFNTSGFQFLSEMYRDIEEKKRKGIILHNILSEISTLSDIDHAVNQAIYRGLITNEESAEFIDHLNECISENRIDRWFDGSGRVLNETDIIVPKDEVRRPDRVVLYQDSVEIIDYKSGSKNLVKEHKRQVLNYMELVKTMGYQNISGYIWYISLDEVISV